MTPRSRTARAAPLIALLLCLVGCGTAGTTSSDGTDSGRSSYTERPDKQGGY